METAEKIALYHHEQWDGSGYPSALQEDEIPAAARIVCVADAVDALAHDRPYRSARPMKYVIGQLVASSGSQFDPVVVDACLEILTSGRVREKSEE
jgi:putative two-component system response regulator